MPRRRAVAFIRATNAATVPATRRASMTATLFAEAPGRLSVANTGPRVPPEQVPGLFEPFRRASGDRLDDGGGVGLGLTIVRSIVNAHRGRVEAWADPAGGLVVAVDLPSR